MTILAVCPYCKAGKIRAPRSALGASATCPRCSNCFTIADSEELRSAPVRNPITRSAAAPSSAVTARRRADAPLDSADPLVENPLEIVIPDMPGPLDYYEPEDDARPGASGFAVALVALIIAGLAFGATQVPSFGRLVALALGAIGLGVGLLALASSDGRWKWPSIGAAANGLCVFLVVVLPSWVNLGPWWPERIEDDSNLVKSVAFSGGSTVVDGEWVDASKGAWQQNDVRVTISAARAGKTEVIGLKDKREWSKSRLLVFGVRVANIGVVRRIAYRSWNEPPPPEGAPVRVTLPDGKLLAPAKLPAGYDFPNKIKHADLFPGKSADDVMVFEVPEKDVEFVRIELPGWAIDSKESVKIHVPRSMVVSAK